MAEALLKKLVGDSFEVESAGFESGKLNPLAVEVMKEIGIDISQNKIKSVFDFFKQGKQYDYVITVCDESQAAKCSVFPGVARKLHWAFDDPSGFQGTWQEKLEKTRAVRDRIKQKIEQWLSSPTK